MQISQEEYNTIVTALHDIQREAKTMQATIDRYESNAVHHRERWNELFDEMARAFDTSMSHDDFRHHIKMICIEHEYCFMCGSYDCTCCECE